MGMSVILLSWKSSLELFRKANLKLFILVCLKNSIGAVSLLVRYFSPFFIVDYVLRYHVIPVEYAFTGLMASRFLISFVMLLCVRASLERKDLAYFYEYFRRIVGVLGLVGIMVGLFFGLLSLTEMFIVHDQYAPFAQRFIAKDLGALLMSLSLLLLPYLSLTSFFLLDSEGRLKNIVHSMTRGLKAIIYYLPACAIFGAFGILAFELVGPLSIVHGIAGWFGVFDHFIVILLLNIGEFIIRSLFRLFFLSIMTNYYLKIKHGNYALFFG